MRNANFLISNERNNEDNEEDEELFLSSLLNFAEEVGISTIGDSLMRVLSSINIRQGQLTDQIAQVGKSSNDLYCKTTSYTMP